MTTATSSAPSAPSLKTSADRPASSVTGEILLESGTNELEVLVFRLRGGWFGVNVAKVREVIRAVRTNHAPNQHENIIGMFNMRGNIIPLVDLAKSLTITTPKEPDVEGRIIITEFNGLRTGFLVDHVDQIYRLSWSKVRPAPDTNMGSSAAGEASFSSTTGIIEMDDRLILMVDFESVADRIVMHKSLHIESVPNDLNVDRPSKRVILAEDSPFMRNLMQKILVNSGYTKLEVYCNGQEAWDALCKPGPKVDAVVSDIEMPRMDGLHLTRRIKETKELRDIPVVLFSSLVSNDNMKKGEAVGADVQIPKPELPEVVRLVDKVVSGMRVGNAQTHPSLAA